MLVARLKKYNGNTGHDKFWLYLFPGKKEENQTLANVL